MEKIKVNMSPNPLDVQTIHASQNDGEARQWEFELHNNGELIDTSEVTEQMVFKSYKGGTEQILPENGAVPVTAPFVGDIKYPQGLLTDQEFAYRQSPTESDGLAKITDIKGNTLVWNQNCYSFSALRSTLSSTVNSQTDITCTAIGEQSSFGIIIRDNAGYFNFIGGHTYLLSMNISKITVNNFSRISPESTMNPQDLARTTGRYTTICNPTVSGPKSILCYLSGTTTTSDKFKFNSVQIIDLTMLNDSRITDYDSFKTYYPLSFYSYDSGSLLSFNGNGIKTTGKNQLNPSAFDYGPVYKYSNGNLTVKSSDPRAWTALSTFHLKKGSYIFTRSVPNGICDIRFGYENFATAHLIANQFSSYPFTVTQDTDVKIKVGYSYSAYPFTTNLMIRFADADSTFEPYTENTTNLPIATYFPTGMKSAGTVYDELTPRKATTRIGSVDLGTLAWYKGDNAEGIFLTSSISNMKYASVATDRQKGILCDKYLPSSVISIDNNMDDKSMLKSPDRFAIRDTTYTDATAFKTAMSGVYLYYELATPTETSFTTASLVTENAEIPLSNEDGVLIGKCTEQLSAEPGFHDAKIKLADADGTCYSNKIQLHVERSPQ